MKTTINVWSWNETVLRFTQKGHIFFRDVTTHNFSILYQVALVVLVSLPPHKFVRME
jgi:hypothetical protein